MISNNKDLNEIDFLKTWSITILDFLSEKDNDYKMFAETTKLTFAKFPAKPNAQMVKGLREAFRDFNEIAKNLPPSKYQELNIALLKKFGKNLETYSNEEVVFKVIKRDKIISDLEYRIIEEKVNELCQISENSSNIESLNNLLLAYCQSKF